MQLHTSQQANEFYTQFRGCKEVLFTQSLSQPILTCLILFNFETMNAFVRTEDYDHV